MDLPSTASLFAIMVLLAALPSASVLLVVTRAITNGVASGIAAATGVVLGDLFFVALAFLGMTALAEVLGSGFAIVKYIGGAYLIWFGISLLRSDSPESMDTSTNQKSSLAASLFAGFALTLGDLKAILFYSSLFPIFITPGTASSFDLTVIVLVTIISVGGVKSYYAYSAKRLMARLAASGGVHHVRPAVGVALTGAGLYVIVRN